MTKSIWVHWGIAATGAFHPSSSNADFSFRETTRGGGLPRTFGVFDDDVLVSSVSFIADPEGTAFRFIDGPRTRQDFTKRGLEADLILFGMDSLQHESERLLRFIAEPGRESDLLKQLEMLGFQESSKNHLKTNT